MLCVNRGPAETTLQHVGGGAQRACGIADERRPVHRREHARLQVGQFVEASPRCRRQRQVVHQHRMLLVGRHRGIPSAEETRLGVP